jgi:hypothetical protein
MELLGRERGTHWGNVEPNPNRMMPWSGRRLLSTCGLLDFDAIVAKHVKTATTLGRSSVSTEFAWKLQRADMHPVSKEIQPSAA